MPGTLHTLAISLKGKHDVSHFKWKKLRTITKVRGLTPGRGTEEDTLRSRFQGRAIWPPELTPSPSHRVHSRSVILVSRLLSREGQSHGLSPSSKCPYHSCHSPQPDPSPQSGLELRLQLWLGQQMMFFEESPTGSNTVQPTLDLCGGGSADLPCC